MERTLRQTWPILVSTCILATATLLGACSQQADGSGRETMAAETSGAGGASAATEAAGESAEAPAATRPGQEEPAAPVVELRTPAGTIAVQLAPERAPVTTKNFLGYVRSGHYAGTIFHRVIPGFMIQGGGFTPEMEEKPTGEPIANEAKNGLKNVRGAIAMARTRDPDSATSQFFINLADNPRLDHPHPDGHGYAVFGKVIEGMEVVDAIAQVPTTSHGPHQNVPREPVVIEEARIRE